MENKNKRTLIFVSIALVLATILIVVAVWAIGFVDTGFEASLGVNNGQSSGFVHFEFEKLKQIGIIK